MARVDRGGQEAARNGIARSPEWPGVEQAHLAKQPACVACNPSTNAGAGLQVHHIFPFHYCIALGRPDLELDERNLITLCETEAGKPGEDHHLLVGHLDDFKSSNLNVRDDAKTTFFGMTASQIKALATFKALEAKRLKPLDEMSPADKDAFKKAMDSQFPL